MSKKAKFECYLHWEGLRNGEVTANSYKTYLGVYETQETDYELEDDCTTPELDEDASGAALRYLDDYAYKVTSCVVKLTRIKTSGRGSKKVIERKNSFELDISNLVGDAFVTDLSEPNEVENPWYPSKQPTIHELILSDKIKTICLTDVLGFKEIHVRPEFFSRYPKAKKVKSGEMLFRDFPDIWSYFHRTDGPALISKAKDTNKLYVVNGNILIPKHRIDNSLDVPGDQDLIDLIEERCRSKKNIVD